MEEVETLSQALRHVCALKKVVSARLWEVPLALAQARATRGGMQAQRLEEPQLGVKQQLQHCSTYWTTEAEGLHVCFVQVTEVGDDEGKAGQSNVTFDHPQRNGVWKKMKIPEERFLQVCI